MNGRYRIAAMASLLALAVFLTYYFHVILGLGTVFSHFFYLPIILAALWWERRSVLVALFLGGLVVVSSSLYMPEELTLNDYARAVMFVAIAFVVASLSGRLKEQQRALRQERDRAQTYLDIAGVLIAAVNADRTVGLINRRGCEILGYREEELVGRDWFDTVVPERFREEMRRAFERFIAGDTTAYASLEKAVVTRSGEERILSWQTAPIRDDEGRITGLLGSGTDITDRIRAESALRAANEEANLYLDIMVHDINNANAVALGYTEVLGGILGGEEKAMVQKLQAGIRLSMEIIQNVTTIRRLRSHETSIRPVDLDAVIRAEIDRHPDSRIVYEGGPVLVAADNLLPEVFTNLVGNSLKFGGPDVEVRISLAERDGDVEVSVEDTGPGLSDQVKPHVFSRFQQEKNKKSGKGLGLYIVRMLVERYGGSIRAEDRVPGRPEEGAAFRFTLKKADRRGSAPETRPFPPGDPKREDGSPFPGAVRRSRGVTSTR